MGCALQQYVREMLGQPHGEAKAIGFKEIRFSREDLAFSEQLFPCKTKYVVVTRKNLTAQSHSKWFNHDPAWALKFSQKQTQELEQWQRNHPYKSFALHTEDFTPRSFNKFLDWYGIKGCKYKNVVHAHD